MSGASAAFTFLKPRFGHDAAPEARVCRDSHYIRPSRRVRANPQMNRRTKRGSARGWLAQAVAVLALVLFGAIPVAEAAACGFEPQRAAQEQASAFSDLGDAAVLTAVQTAHEQRPDGKTPKSDFRHADACTHGHCHHAAVPMPAQPASAPEPAVDAALLQAGGSRAPPTIHPAFPKRPPRV